MGTYLYMLIHLLELILCYFSFPGPLNPIKSKFRRIRFYIIYFNVVNNNRSCRGTNIPVNIADKLSPLHCITSVFIKSLRVKYRSDNTLY